MDKIALEQEIGSVISELEKLAEELQKVEAKEEDSLKKEASDMSNFGMGDISGHPGGSSNPLLEFILS